MRLSRCRTENDRNPGELVVLAKLFLKYVLATVFEATSMMAIRPSVDLSASTTIFFPSRERAWQPTHPTPPPTTGELPDETLPPRPWHIGFANGVMPLQLDDDELAVRYQTIADEVRAR